MNKSEIQARVEKCESELASLKAELTKCDCTDGIEQEKCWFGVTVIGDFMTTIRRTKEECGSHCEFYRPAYMPECRQVTAEDALLAGNAYLKTLNKEHLARELHKLGFRMKVTP